MPKKGKILSLVLLILIIIISVVFGVYRNPKIEYAEKGKLKSNNLIVMSGIFNRVPQDIYDGLIQWQDTLTERYYNYSERYSEFNVYYDTKIEDSKTVINFEGEGVLKETGEKEIILDAATLDFELYKMD